MENKLIPLALGLVFYTLVLHISFSNGQIIEFEGGCPTNVSYLKNFNATKFTGKWYQAASYFSWIDPAGHCNTKDIQGVKKYIATITSFNLAANNAPLITIMKMSQQGTDGIYSVKLTLFGIPTPIKMNYYVMAYDEKKKYAITSACYDMKFMRLKFAWILGRTAYPIMELIQGYKALGALGIDKKKMIPTDQYFCTPH